jgi:Fe-S oxidoreductase/nitrate reductase gamma subunit
MNPKSIIFTIIFIVSMTFLTISIRKLIAFLKVGQPEDRSGNTGARIKNVLSIAFGQTKIFRDSTAGPIHAGIFWGFLVLMFSAAEGIFQGFYPAFSWSFLGPFYSAITLSTDIFSVFIIIAVIISFLRRFVFKVERLQGDKDEAKDASIVLLLIFIITTSLLLEKSALAAVFIGEEWAVTPISSFLGGFLPVDYLRLIYEIGWWIHIGFILMLMNYLPFSKHLHVYSSIPNVYLSTIGPVNKLKTIDFEDESIEQYGVSDAEHHTWKLMLDSMTCTHCGRCDEVCPAYITGKDLSPRDIMVELRARTYDKAPLIIKAQNAVGEKPAEGEAPDYEYNEADQAIMDKPYIGDYQNKEALWECTTCGACMQECPVMNEHVPAIVDMRRSLVMMEADFPPELQSSFSDMENNGCPWAVPAADRMNWAEGKDIKTCADNQDSDVLFWVGCAGIVDERAQKIALAFTELMDKAGVNFTVLGTEEQCCGDPARRTGNEYLADMLVKSNMETFENYNVKKMVTTCPHCLNTFKNEYPDAGAKFEVVHHAEFLNELVAAGKLKFKPNSSMNVTYHDSCYLGRYNETYDAPREALGSIRGLEINEPKRSKDKGFCCGGGGGQMFMEETKGKRVNLERTEELMATGADTIALNCPFCMTMITDGVKEKEVTETVKVKDIAEIMFENLAD